MRGLVKSERSERRGGGVPAPLSLVVVLTWVLIPTTAYAQASIAGIVRDTSGAVLPGVTVEAASPALIEKVRTVVTDGTGQYQIVNLVPGTYTVTFTLAGFATVRREGIALTGSFTATVNAELRVGALEETITVTGETPIVDVQGTTRQRVLDHAIIDAIPAGRNPYALGVLTPGVSVATANHDVGGSTINATTALSIHGSRGQDQSHAIAGISMNAMASAGFTTRLVFNMASLQEVALDYSAGSAELNNGGVRINYIPRDGGNTFNGTFFGAFTDDSMQGSNFTQDLRDRGLSTPNSVKKLWDVNFGFGGPLRRDRVWFYASGLYNGAHNYVAGLFYNRNANNPNLWTYDPDRSRPASNDTSYKGGDLRLTWQATPRNKIAFTGAYQAGCSCPGGLTATIAPEADLQEEFPLQRRLVVDWSSPVTNRFLLEAGALQHNGLSIRNPSPGLSSSMISVVEQSSGLRYRGHDNYRRGPNLSIHARIAASYITGAHAFKVGFTHNNGYEGRYAFDNGQPLTYRFNNGVPNRITQRAWPYDFRVDVDHNLGLFAQDKWTIKRLTFNYGVRYDYFANSFPEQRLGPTPLTPTRDITFPAASNLAWHDITPKSALSYDVFGDGKTAVKVTLNKYLRNMAAGSQIAQLPNPVNSIAHTTTRSWNDANRNYVPDCDLINPNANGECGGLADRNFGLPIRGSTYDPDLMRGWGKRDFNWEFSAGVQREIVSRVSADIGYFRRWYGNFVVTDNRTVGPSDYDSFNFTAPADPRLPGGGGGYVVSGLHDLKQAKFGQPADNFVTRAQNYGEQREYWHGVDVNLNARPRASVLLQGGFSTGRTVTDNCEVVAKLPEMLFEPTDVLGADIVGWLPAQYCKLASDLLTQVKFLGSYTIPRIDVQVSGTLQSIPGPNLRANYVAINAVVAPSLGRSLSGGTANVTVNLIEPGTMYGERLNQLDLRIAKLFRFGRTRSAVNFDVYNALNGNVAMTENFNFAAWRRPTRILVARFAKVGVQFDF